MELATSFINLGRLCFAGCILSLYVNKQTPTPRRYFKVGDGITEALFKDSGLSAMFMNNVVLRR